MMEESEQTKNNAAWLYADLDHNVLSLRSRISDSLAGKNVLSRTVGQLAQAELLSEIVVFCPKNQVDQIGQLLLGCEVTLRGLENEVPFSKRLSHRKWSLESWRGGIDESTLFDEPFFTEEMILYGREHGHYFVLSVPCEAVLVDPQLLDKLIEHQIAYGDDMRFTFTQAAPGLCVCGYRLDLLHELRTAGASIGHLLRYDPDAPRADYIMQECVYKVGPKLYGSRFRYIADTQRSFDTIEKFLQNETNGSLENWDAEKIIEAVETRQQQTDILPHEIEIEINTDTSLRINGYPHRRDDTDRPAMTLAQFRKIVSQLGQYDDICLTIGGFGEPLAHPELLGMIKAAKDAGVFGINIETDGLLLKGQLADKLSETNVDIISVYLDANSRELYQQIKGQDRFDELVAQLESFVERNKEKNGTAPLLLPHLVKSNETIAQMEEFYDRWKRTAGCAVIVGHNDFAGQIPSQAVMNMAPPNRRPCRRLSRYMTILADGTVTICSQDFNPEHPIGNVKEKTIKEIWQGPELEHLRKSHHDRKYDANSLCQNCKDWHRW